MILIIHPKINSPILKSIPAPLMVLIVTIPMVFIINLIGDPGKTILGSPLFIDKDHLIEIPTKVEDIIIFPNFSKISEPAFWVVVISITLVATIETLIIAKAVDKLDIYKRRSNLNKDLFAVGLGTMTSGFLGGLPIISVIVRSSVNVNNNAKTKWSNFYHGILLILFVFLFPSLINEIPLACLAAILMHTGFKLAAPTVFSRTLQRGWEQLLIFVITIIASLAINLLWGILIGVMATLIIHWLRSQLEFRTFIRHMANSEVNVVEESNDDIQVEIKGIANFMIVIKLIRALEKISINKNFVVNFSRTKLVDSTLLEFMHEHREKYFTKNDFSFVGLDVHQTSSPHPLALHILKKPMPRRLTGRQIDIYRFASENRYKFHPEINWEVDHFEKFKLLGFHIIEYHRNRIIGNFGKYAWEISDLTYNDGILMAREEHHLTVMAIHLTHDIANFIINRKNLRKLKIQAKKNTNDTDDSGILDSFEDLNALLLENEAYYLEGKESEILIYRKERLLSASEIVSMHDFAKKLYVLIPEEDVSNSTPSQ